MHRGHASTSFTLPNSLSKLTSRPMIRVVTHFMTEMISSIGYGFEICLLSGLDPHFHSCPLCYTIRVSFRVLPDLWPRRLVTSPLQSPNVVPPRVFSCFSCFTCFISSLDILITERIYFTSSAVPSRESSKTFSTHPVSGSYNLHSHFDHLDLLKLKLNL